MEQFQKILKNTINKNKSVQKDINSNFDSLISQLDTYYHKLSNQENNNKEILSEMNESVQKQKPLKKLQEINQDLHNYISKTYKTVQILQNYDINSLYFECDEKYNDLLQNQIAEKFMRDGKFQILLNYKKPNQIQEIQLENYKQFYNVSKQYYKIYNKFKQKKLDNVIQWALQNKVEIQKINKNLLFILIKLKFIQILNHQGKYEAIIYARNHSKEFGDQNIKQIQELMAKLLTVQNKNIQINDDQLWSSVRCIIYETMCKLYNISLNLPMDILCNEGFKSIPIFLQSLKLLKDKKLWLKQNEYPIEIVTQQKFHTQIICPISKDIIQGENHPLLLQCHHIISKFSYDKMIANKPKIICPLCNKILQKDKTNQIFT